MRMFKKSLLLAALATFMGTGVANATTVTFNLTSDHCTGGCLVGSSAGTITVNDAGGVLNFTVSLLAPYNFMSGGFDATFGFNLDPNQTVTYSNITSGFSGAGTLTNTASAQTLHMDGVGDFEYGIDWDGGNGSGNSTHTGLSFTVTGTSALTVAALQQNALNQYFALDVASISANGGTGNTGALDASAAPTVPDGGTTAGLLGLAMLGVGYLRRRLG